MNLNEVKAEIKALNEERIEILKERETLEKQIQAIEEKYQPERRGNVTFALPGWVQRKLQPLKDGIAECNEDLKEVVREIQSLEKLQYDLELAEMEPRRAELRIELAEKVKAYNAAMNEAIALGRDINRFIIQGNAEVGSPNSSKRHTLLSNYYAGDLINFDRVPKVMVINGRAQVVTHCNIQYATEQEEKRGRAQVVTNAHVDYAVRQEQKRGRDVIL